MTSETLYILGRIKKRIINAAEDVKIESENFKLNKHNMAIQEGLYQALSIVQEYCDKGEKEK